MTSTESTVYSTEEIKEVAAFIARVLVEEAATRQQLGYYTPARISLSQQNTLKRGPSRTVEIFAAQPTLFCDGVRNEVFRLLTKRKPLRWFVWALAGTPWHLRWTSDAVTLGSAPRTHYPRSQ